jgi:hypothetical protein
MSEKKVIHIALPNLISNLNKYLLIWVGKVAANKEHQEKYDFKWNLRDDKPIDNNRNKIVKDFLECKEGGDFLFMVDSDQSPFKDPIPLVELDLDVVICPTPVFNNKRDKVGGFPIYHNCMDYVPEKDGWIEHYPQSGLQEIDAGGTGQILIARRVLEKVKPAFARRWNDEGIATHGSDFDFCRRVKEEGFRIWAHYDYPSHHWKEVDLLTLASSMMARDISRLPRHNMNTQNYWDEQWDKRPERELPFYEVIKERTLGLKVLDFGCGRGDLLARLNSGSMGMDISEKAVEVCKSRGLDAKVGTEPEGQWDFIVCTEVLEHIDDDLALYNKFFEHTNRVLFSVPNDCLPPGLEPEHRRVYTIHDVKHTFPHVKEILCLGEYMLVYAEKEGEKKPARPNF